MLAVSLPSHKLYLSTDRLMRRRLASCTMCSWRVPVAVVKSCCNFLRSSAKSRCCHSAWLYHVVRLHGHVATILAILRWPVGAIHCNSNEDTSTSIQPPLPSHFHFHFDPTSTSISLPLSLRSNFHFHLTSTSTSILLPLPF